MKQQAITLSSIVTLIATSTNASAQLANLTYTEAELFKPLVVLNDEIMVSQVAGVAVRPRGSNAAMVLGGNFVVMGSADSGKPPGVLHFLDLSDPRAPKRISATGDAEFREIHSMPTAHVGGKFITVLPSTTGIQTWDLTDPAGGPKKLGALKLTGVTAGDYDNTVWQMTMGWPYAYIATTAAGIYVVDISDPAAPTVAHQITSGEMGIGKVGPVHLAGNLLIATNMETAPMSVGVIDVSDPTNPIMLGKGQGPAGKKMYSSLLIGDRIYFPGDLGAFHVAKWQATAGNASVEFIAEVTIGSDKGGYCTYQEKFLFCGQSKIGFFKIDVSDEKALKSVGTGMFGSGQADMDFASVFGNLVFIANDHTPGPQGAFMPHQAAPDTTPPTALKLFPAPSSKSQVLGTKFTVFFSDDIDLATVNEKNFIVYAVGSNVAVPGVFQRSSPNAITFSPRKPLTADTTYGVMLRAKEGLTDVAGNAVAADVELGRIATGLELDLATPPLADGMVVPPVETPPVPVDPAPVASGAGGNAPVSPPKPLDAPPEIEAPPPVEDPDQNAPPAPPAPSDPTPPTGTDVTTVNSSSGCVVEPASRPLSALGWCTALVALVAVAGRRRWSPR